MEPKTEYDPLARPSVFKQETKSRHSTNWPPWIGLPIRMTSSFRHLVFLTGFIFLDWDPCYWVWCSIYFCWAWYSYSTTCISSNINGAIFPHSFAISLLIILLVFSRDKLWIRIFASHILRGWRRVNLYQKQVYSLLLVNVGGTILYMVDMYMALILNFGKRLNGSLIEKTWSPASRKCRALYMAWVAIPCT